MSGVQLNLRDPNGIGIFINVKPNAVSITFDEETVYTFDGAGRLVTAVLEGRTYRRGLDNRVLAKWPEGPRGLSAQRSRMLNGEEARLLVERVYRDVVSALDLLPGRSSGGGNPAFRDAIAHLDRIARSGWAALVADAEKYATVYRPIGILPPDQYLAVVLQATEGCSFNRCAFCNFYRDRPFRIKERGEFREHMESVLDFFGEGIAIRKSVFLADANATCIPRDTLLPMLDDINERMPVRLREAGGSLKGIYSFVDAFSDGDREPIKYAEMRQRNVRRLYLGVESGCRELLRFLHKPQEPEGVREVVLEMKEGGLDVGIILMLGIGGDRFAERHVRETLDLVNSLPWTANDLVFLSPFIEHLDLEYLRLARKEGIRPLSPMEMEQQYSALRHGVKLHASFLRTALYGLEEFLY